MAHLESAELEPCISLSVLPRALSLHWYNQFGAGSCCSSLCRAQGTNHHCKYSRTCIFAVFIFNRTSSPAPVLLLPHLPSSLCPGSSLISLTCTFCLVAFLYKCPLCFDSPPLCVNSFFFFLLPSLCLLAGSGVMLLDWDNPCLVYLWDCL